MTTPMQEAESLADSLTDVCRDALRKAGFPPSDKLLEKIYEDIKSAISLT